MLPGPLWRDPAHALAIAPVAVRISSTPPTLRDGAFRTELHRAAGLSSQAARDTQLRRAWVGVWLAILYRAGAAALAFPGLLGGRFSDRLLSSVFYHAASTLSKHAGYWLRFEQWAEFSAATSVYPPSAVALADYILELVDGGCGPSVPQAVRDACTFAAACSPSSSHFSALRR